MAIVLIFKLDVYIFELNLANWAVVMVNPKVGLLKFVQLMIIVVLTRIQLKGVTAALYHSIVTRI